ncbi:MAG: hypothetical protein V3U37_07185 [Nitrospinaceae bacterium]
MNVKGFHVSLFFFYSFIFIVSPSTWAFDDNSTDHTRSLTEIRTICESGATVTDGVRAHFSCSGEDVYVNRHQSTLYKNGTPIANQNILDFKISRNGRVYYRTRDGGFLYDENGKLESNGEPVTLYLVATTGDVVYLNERGEIFKNGAPLKHGPSFLRIIKKMKSIDGKTKTLIVSPVVSRNGLAVFLDKGDNLYVDGKRMNPRTSRVTSFKINSTGDVYYVDKNNRLFRNTGQLFDGKFRVLDFQLSPAGEAAYLTKNPANNLFLENQVLSAGARRVVEFHFNSSGEVFYRDEDGGLWKNGRQISK